MPEPTPPKPRDMIAMRRRRFWLLGGAVLLSALVWGLYWILVSSHQVSTDNAYVGADTAQVTPQISGAVAKVLVSETQVVTAGQTLVIFDDADARNAVAQAQAALSQAQRQVEGYFANDTALASQEGARQAEIAKAEALIGSAEADYARAKTDLDRRQALAASGAVSGDELSNAQNRFSTAKAELLSARAARAQALASHAAANAARAVNFALISGVSAAGNPDVLAAKARLDAAELALERTVVRAPINGIVAKKTVQLGQQVAVGTPLMSLVPNTESYVDANFKEVQLAKVREGQPVVLTSDYWGSEVIFHGQVKGMSGGTGAAFSLIPAQNASGNWIKIVQRLPVRIRLDPAELLKHPLRVGLSMKATIDVSSPPHA